MREWSKFQLAIFEFIKTMATHLVILARAGTGKTTTIVEVANRLPKTAKIVFTSFTNSILDEL